MRTPLATLTLTLALSLPGLASADVYKCPAQGGRTYQNMPCERLMSPPFSPQAGQFVCAPAR